MRLFTRRATGTGLHRFPWISEALASLATQSATMDGEAVCCGPDGMPDFDLLHGGRNDGAAFLQAFDLIQLDGQDLRDRPLEERKAKLARLLRGSDGIRSSNQTDAYISPAGSSLTCAKRQSWAASSIHSVGARAAG